MWPLTETFEFEGNDIAWSKAGSGSPLILIHGTPFASFVWRKIGPLLAQTFEVYMFDLLGYGQSAMPLGDDVSLGRQNEVLAAFIEQAGLSKPNVIAHDFGGATALRAHLLNEIEFEKLMLIDPVAIRPWGSPFVQHVRHHEAAFAGQPDYIQAAVLDAYIGGAVHYPLNRDVLSAYTSPWRGEPGQAAFYQQIAQMDQTYTDEIEPRLSEVRCPVRLLWGLDDLWISPESGRKIAKMLPDCTYSEVENCGHLMQEDAPEAVIAAALSFFDQ